MSILFKSNNKIYSLKSNILSQLPSDDVQNFIEYGVLSIDNFNAVRSTKNYILTKNDSEDVDGLWKQEINRKPLSIKFE